MPIIDLSFVLVGTTFPLDHGYSLFSAICRVVPGLHGDRRIGVHPIRGRQTAPGVLTLDDRSRLKLRLPSQRMSPRSSLWRVRPSTSTDIASRLEFPACRR